MGHFDQESRRFRCLHTAWPTQSCAGYRDNDTREGKTLGPKGLHEQTHLIPDSIIAANSPKSSWPDDALTNIPPRLKGQILASGNKRGILDF
jgi:hypothetical protein